MRVVVAAGALILSVLADVPSPGLCVLIHNAHVLDLGVLVFLTWKTFSAVVVVDIGPGDELGDLE